MKKSSTYYFLIQTVLHVCFGWALVHLNGIMTHAYSERFAGLALPLVTNLAILLHLWPYALASAAAIGAVASVVLCDRFRILQHLSFAMQCASSFLMLISAVGYAMPIVPIIFPIGN